MRRPPPCLRHAVTLGALCGLLGHGLLGARTVALAHAAGAAIPSQDDVAALLAQAEAAAASEDEASRRSALVLYERALQELEGRGRTADEASALEGLAAVHFALGALQASLERFELARARQLALGNAAEAAGDLNQIGALHNALGRNDEALTTLTRALAEWRALGHIAGEAEALNNLAYVHYSRGDNARALELYRRALALREAAGEEGLVAQTRNYMALVLSAMGRHHDALDEYRRSLESFRARGERYLEAAARHNVARMRMELGETDAALEDLDQALTLARTAGDRRSEAYVRHTLAQAWAILGEPGAALRELHAARRSFEELADAFGLAQVLLRLGRQLAALGEVDDARANYTRALALLRAQGDRQGEAKALHGLALAQATRDDWAGAHEQLVTALELTRGARDRSGETVVLISLGEAQRELGRLDEALASFEQALRLARETGVTRDEALAWQRSGRASAERGDVPEALRRLALALALQRAARDRGGVVRTLDERARVYAGRGELAAAQSDVEAALDEAEALRGAVPGDELRTAYLASVQPLYELALEVRLRRHAAQPQGGHLAAAFELSERARARALLDALSAGGVEVHRGVDPALLDERTRVRRRLGTREEQLRRLAARPPADAQRRALEQDLDALRREYRDVSLRLAAASPRWAALAQTRPAGLTEVQQRLLDDDTLLLEYALGDERSHVWLVARDAVQVFDLPGRAVLEAVVQRLTELLAARDRRPRFESPTERRRRLTDADAALGPVAAELGRLLLAPLGRRLGHKRLVIVAPGVLQHVPFALLPEPGGGPRAVPLVATHELVGAPSASVLLALRREPRQRGGAGTWVAVLADPVFGLDDPRLAGHAALSPSPAGAPRLAEVEALGPLRRLPYTRREAERIRALVPGGRAFVALGFDASRDTVQDERLRSARILHFATHAFADGRHPELSGLVLSLYDREGRLQDGVLRLGDVYDLALGAELVVLSACRTALGRDVRGEGLQSLARAFFYAGAPRLVASLWSASDRATAELMTRFYDELLRRGRPPAAALRAAQLALRRDPRWRHPYDWAAFTFQGDWRP